MIQDSTITTRMKSVLKEMTNNMNSLEKRFAVFEFQDNLRDFWHYIPIERHGLTIENAQTYTVKKIWDLAEKVDHHPDILLTYSGIKIILFTHDQSGVTKKDIDFARDLEKIY